VGKDIFRRPTGGDRRTFTEEEGKTGRKKGEEKGVRTECH
jgi:hypothetical protein